MTQRRDASSGKHKLPPLNTGSPKSMVYNSRRSSTGSVTSFSEDRNGKKILIQLSKARIYTYDANTRPSVADNMGGGSSSLRRVDSIESIKSNITEILSPEIGSPHSPEFGNVEGGSSEKRHSTKGRLIAHGFLTVYEIEGGIKYLSCGGGLQTTRETFVHPLLPRLKIFKVNDKTFILMMAHPERFWEIVFDWDDPGSESGDLQEMEQILKKNCVFIDIIPPLKVDTSQLAKPVLESEPEAVFASNSETEDARKKGKFGNRLSKFFKNKAKTRPGAGGPGGEARYENASGVLPSTSHGPSSLVHSEVVASTNYSSDSSLFDNNSSKSKANDGSSLATDYIDKMIDQKVEQKVKSQLKKRRLKEQKEAQESDEFAALTHTTTTSSTMSSNVSVLYDIMEETDAKFGEFEDPGLLNNLTEKLNNDVNDEIFYSKQQQRAKRNSLYMNDENWMEVKENLKNRQQAFEKLGKNADERSNAADGELDEEEEEEDFFDPKPKFVARDKTKNFSTRSFINYQPYAASHNDDVKSFYTTRTFAYKNNLKTKMGDRSDAKNGYNLKSAFFGEKKESIDSKDVYDLIMSDKAKRDKDDKSEKLEEKTGLMRFFGW